MSSIIYTQQHLSEHLLGYWPLNKTAENLIDPARFGQYTATDITYVPGKVKVAASFNGTTSESLQPNLNLEGLTELTLSCWIKPDTTNKYAFVCSQWLFPSNTTFGLSKYSNGQLAVHIAESNTDNPGNNYMFSTNANLQVGVWTHIAFVYNGKLTGSTNRLKIYQDGVQLGTEMGLGSSSLSTGLISYWPLKGNSNDLVGTNNGIDTNIIHGTTSLFNTTTSKIAITDLNITAAQTRTLSINFMLNKFRVVLFSGSPTAGNGYLGAITSTTNYFGDWVTSGIFSHNFSVGVWYTLTMTFNNGVVRSYLNGAESITGPLTMDPAGYFNISSFGGYDPSVFNLDGEIRDVAFYDRVLTGPEITALNAAIIGNIGPRLYGTHNFLIGDLDYTDNSLKFDGDVEAVAVWGRALDESEILRICKAPTSLNDGLFSFWKLNGNSNDSVGANHGIDTDINYVAGKKGLAADFNFTSSEIQIPYNSQFNFTDGINDLPFNVSGWIYSLDGSNLHWIIAKRPVTTGWQIVLFNNIINFALLTDGSNYIVSSSITLVPNNVWTHISCNYDGSKNVSGLTIYINGVQSLVTPQTLGVYSGIVPEIANVKIGRSTFGSYHFLGQMDEIGIWNRELTPSQITELYNTSYPFAGKGFQLMPTPGYDNDAQDWFDLMTPMPTTPFKFAINEIFKGLKNNGIWEKLDYLLLMATETQQQSLIPLKNHTLFTPAIINSMQWIESVGYAGGAGTYLNTDFKPEIDGVNYQQDDASYGHFLIKLQSGIVGANGCYTVPGTLDTNAFFSSTQLSFAINDSSGTVIVTPTKIGLISLVRQGISQVSAYFNGTLINNYAKGSAGVPNIDYYVGARNANGSPGEYGVDETHAAVYFGSSTINFSAFNQIMQDYALRRIGLVAFYPLNGNAFDAIYSTHGIQSTVSYNAAKHGDYGALFNGVNGSITVPYTAKLNSVTTDMSLSVWVKTNSLDNKIVLIKYSDAPGNGEYFITLSSNKWKARLLGGFYDVTSIDDAVIGQWTHLVFTAVEGGDLKFYVNNVLQGTTSGLTGILPGNNFDLSLGKWTTAYWSGMLQDLGIWNRVLNEYEIARLYNSGNGFKVY